MWRVVVCVIACACGRVGFDPIGDGGATGDGAGGGDAAVACTTWGAFSTPTRVAELSSTSLDWAPSLSADGRQIVLSSNRSGNHELYTSTRSSPTASDWTPPAAISELTNMFDEEDDSTTSTNGLEMIYGKTLIFRTTRATTASTWGPRTTIVPALFDFVQGSELSANDLRLYFNMGTGRQTVYMMERATPNDAFGPYAAISDPDPAGDLGYITLSVDERELFASSDHGGQRDIYTSVRPDRNAPFPQVTLVPELSSAAEEWDPELSRDGTELFLASNRVGGGGNQDIFVAHRVCAD